MRKYYHILAIFLFLCILTGCEIQSDNNAVKKVMMNINTKHYDDINKLYKDSSVIVIGKAVKKADAVKDTYSSVDPDEQVYTQTYVQISEILKGKQQVGNTIIIHQPGGVFNNTQYVVKGTEYINMGERYVLFLKDEGNENYTLMSPYEGIIDIVNDNLSIGPENSVLYSRTSLTQLRKILENMQNITEI